MLNSFQSGLRIAIIGSSGAIGSGFVGNLLAVITFIIAVIIAIAKNLPKSFVFLGIMLIMKIAIMSNIFTII